MPALCDLKERHGVDLGRDYRHDKACATFVKYIAASLREDLRTALNESLFFSVQINGSTDWGNIEE